METNLHSWFLANQGARYAQAHGFGVSAICILLLAKIQLHTTAPWEDPDPLTSIEVEYSGIYTKSVTPKMAG